MTIGLCGYGRVAKALIEHWKQVAPELKIAFILREHHQWINDEELLVSDLVDLPFVERTALDELLRDHPIDVWFELTPTDVSQAEVVHERLQFVLMQGIHVISANKAPIVLDYLTLKQTADAAGARLGLSAVMGANLPAEALCRYGAQGSKIKRMRGILNSTTNYMLERMEQGMSFRDALSCAQADGIAEPHWRYDVEGFDSGFKMAIIASVLHEKNVPLLNERVHGIQDLTQDEIEAGLAKNQRYKLVATYDQTGVSVKPELIPSEDMFYQVGGSEKILRIETDCLSDLSVISGKSGLSEVAASIHRDLLRVTD